MAKRVNYGLEKRQRELAKQKKKEQKRAERRKLEKESSLAEGTGEGTPGKGPLGSDRDI